MFNRQKLLLKLINELTDRKISSRTVIVKSLFLLKEEYFLSDHIKFYSFFPYKQGPFSQQCFSDLRYLKRENLIDDNETKITKKGKELLKKQDFGFYTQINHLLGRFDNKDMILKYIYSKYPKFTVKSTLIKHKKNKDKKTGINTIGYEGKNIDKFLNNLIQNDINLIIDVRKNPFSMNFAFIKKKLKEYLNSVDIDYMHIPELGIESESRKELNTKEDYQKLFKEYRKKLPQKKEFTDKIISLSRNNNVALLCFEKDSNYCHRGQIANFVRKNNIKVQDL